MIQNTLEHKHKHMTGTQRRSQWRWIVPARQGYFHQTTGTHARQRLRPIDAYIPRREALSPNDIQ